MLSVLTLILSVVQLILKLDIVVMLIISTVSRPMVQWSECNTSLEFRESTQRQKPENSVSWNRKWWRHNVVTVEINEGKALPSPPPFTPPHYPFVFISVESSLVTSSVSFILLVTRPRVSALLETGQQTSVLARLQRGRTRTARFLSDLAVF